MIDKKYKIEINATSSKSLSEVKDVLSKVSGVSTEKILVENDDTREFIITMNLMTARLNFAEINELVSHMLGHAYAVSGGRVVSSDFGVEEK